MELVARLAICSWIRRLRFSVTLKGGSNVHKEHSHQEVLSFVRLISHG